MLENNLYDNQSQELSSFNNSEMQKKMNDNVSVEEKLLEQKIITKEQLDIAKSHKAENQMIGSVLVDMGFISENTLYEFLLESSNIKKFNISEFIIDKDILSIIPKEVSQQNGIIPIIKDDINKVISLACADVYNIVALDKVKPYLPAGYKIESYHSNSNDIENIIDNAYGYDMSLKNLFEELESSSLKQEKLSGEDNKYANPVVRLVDALLIDAVKLNASDIHIEPEQFFVRLRYRIDGELQQMSTFHKELLSAIVVRIKILSNINIAETRKPQDGRIYYKIGTKEVDLRVSSQPSVFGENIVMRILDKNKALLPIKSLGYNENNRALLEKALAKPEGVIIVTGPTGSGKSTTLYSILKHINDIGVNIMTLEDPVEYTLPLIRQTQINPEANMTFQTGIKSLMRQDPDIILLGEIRDSDTATMAIRAAMTGHKVFSTLHTNSASAAIPRLLDIGVTKSLIATSIVSVIAQRLVRKLCDNCKQKSTLTEEEAELLKVPKEQIESTVIYRKSKCEKCNSMGYKGRVALSEILLINKQVAELIEQSGAISDIEKLAKETSGFQPMHYDGRDKILAGLTDIETTSKIVDLTKIE